MLLNLSLSTLFCVSICKIVHVFCTFHWQRTQITIQLSISTCVGDDACTLDKYNSRFITTLPYLPHTYADIFKRINAPTVKIQLLSWRYAGKCIEKRNWSILITLMALDIVVEFSHRHIVSYFTIYVYIHIYIYACRSDTSVWLSQ